MFTWLWKWQEDAPTWGPGPMGSARYKEGAERNMLQKKRVGQFLRRTWVPVFVVSLIVLGVSIALVAV
jgi:hypothetical protein